MFLLIVITGYSSGAVAAVSAVKTIEISNSSAASQNILQLAEIVARRDGSNIDVAQTAMGATAVATTTYGNNLNRYGPLKSIDGSASPGSDSSQNYFHSGVGGTQRLTITLANPESLSSISLVGRADCCSTRDVYDLTLRDENGQVLASYAALDANTGSHTATVELNGNDSQNNNTLASVSKIVIRSAASSGSQIIQLAEVVARRQSDNADVAQQSAGATATVVSTYANNISRYGVDNAIDGSTAPGRDSNSNYYHSGTGANQQVTITLAQPEQLSNLTLIGRADCCSSRDVYDVSLLGANDQVLANYPSLSANTGSHLVNVQFSVTQASSPATQGSWGPVLDWPLVSVSMANLPDGRILSYSGSERRTWPSTERTYSVIWDPQTGGFTERLHVGHNMFCAATAMTEDGGVFVNGGRNSGNSPWTSIFDYETNSWNQNQNMASGGRWYPTTLQLGNGDILTAMGNSTNTRNPEVWNDTSGWRMLNGIDFLSMRQNHNESGRENVFPLLSLAPNGDVFHFWDTTENHYLSTDGNGQSANANSSSDHGDHAGGVHVMYDVGKLLVSGQNDGSWGGNSSIITNAAFTVDMNGTDPVIQSSGPMTSVRKFHQMIPLPTSEVLVVGGNTTGTKFADNGSVLHAEIWNPQTRQFRSAASMSIPRDYHSTALLLTDGRVITAGGGYHPNNPDSSGTHQDAQIYSPPYLFNEDGDLAPRPNVSVLVDLVEHGEQFAVQTSGNIAYFSLIKMSSTSHAINTDVRQFQPAFTALGNNQYSLTMHANPNVATPGYWMLFAIDNSGVPSVADTIKVVSVGEGEGGGTGEPPEVQPMLSSASQTGNIISYSVSASGQNLTYSWNFGDGSGDTPASSNANATHTYVEPGRYVINVTVADSFGNETVESFTQMVHRPIVAGTPKASSGVAEVPARNEVYIVNPDNNSVTVVNSVSLNKITEISVGAEPRAVALAPNGNVWVVNKASSSISVINTESRSVVQTISLDAGAQPHGIVFSSSAAYVAMQALGSVVQLSPTNGNELRRRFAGDNPRHLSLNASGNRLFVSAFITPPIPGEHTASPNVANGGGEIRVFATSASSLSLQNQINLNYSNREISEHSGPGMPNYIGPAVVSPDGTAAWVPSKQDNVLGGLLRSGAQLEFDQAVRAITSMVNLQNETEVLANRVDHDNASVGSHGAFGPNGLMFFTTLEGNRQVALIDTTTALEIARFDTGHAPQSVVVSADGTRLYVHNFMDRSLSVFDINAVVQSGETTADEIGRVGLVANENLTGNALIGKRLFYDARDDRLSSLDYMSCASCHNEAGHDGRTWDFTASGEGLRNTISLQGTGGMQHGLLHWSANFDELQDFEDQIRNFAGGDGLMPDSSYFAGSRSSALGDTKTGLSADLDALAVYLTSLDEFPVNPNRTNNALDATAESGKVLFTDKGCVDCHTGMRATDSSDSPNLHNVGTLDQESGSRLSGALLGIDTPTLLGAWNTAPYLHDGSAQSLQQAISSHTTISLNAQELAQLASYIEQLSVEDLPLSGGGEGHGQVVRQIVIRSAAGSGSEVIQLAEIIATRATDGVDVATSSNGASASVASTYANRPSQYGVTKALDGDATPGRDQLANYYHSGTATGQAVTVTLAQSEVLSSITLIGRADCCSGRDRYSVTLLDDSGTVIASYATMNADNSAHSATVTLDAITTPPTNQVKQIEVSSAANSGSNYIQLAEVVARRASDNVDIAQTSQGASATAVSTYADNVNRFGVNKAIDGSISAGTNQLRNYYHSRSSSSEKVTITLLEAQSLASITLVGRADCCSSRDKYRVKLIDEAGEVLADFLSIDANNGAHSATVNINLSN